MHLAHCCARPQWLAQINLVSWSSVVLWLISLFCIFLPQMCAPANTPATPPNFPDALVALSKLSTSDKMATSPIYATSPPNRPPQNSQAAPPMGISSHNQRWVGHSMENRHGVNAGNITVVYQLPSDTGVTMNSVWIKLKNGKFERLSSLPPLLPLWWQQISGRRWREGLALDCIASGWSCNSLLLIWSSALFWLSWPQPMFVFPCPSSLSYAHRLLLIMLYRTLSTVCYFFFQMHFY